MAENPDVHGTGMVFAARLPARWLLTVFAVTAVPAALLMSSSTPASACTPPPGGLTRYSVADRTLRAPVVLVGKITSVEGDQIQTATIEVEEYIKGDGPPEVEIANFGPTSLCLSPVRQDLRAIFFARGEPGKGLNANYTGQFDAVATADADSVSEARAAAEGKITPTPTPSPTPTTTPTMTPTLTPTVTPTVTPPPTLEPTLTPTATDSPTPTPSRTPTVTPTLEPTVASTPTAEPTVAPTVTPRPTPSSLPKPTPTAVATATETSAQIRPPVPSGTPTRSSGGPCSGPGSATAVEGALSLLLLISPAGLVGVRSPWRRVRKSSMTSEDKTWKHGP